MAKLSRRVALSLAFAIAGFWGLSAAVPRAEQAADPDLTREAILNDPQAPVGGNPQGDVTVVAFFDYNCIYCMKSEPELNKLLKSDHGIRVVYKDWPIFGEVSSYAAQVALAAKLQLKYGAVHDALLAAGAKKSSKDQVRDIAQKAGVDMTRLDADLAAHGAEIEAILKRNDKQATGMGFQGTPVYLIGPFLVASPLDLAGFQKTVADARKRQAK
ncbi:DsbA family protein [Methylocapsa acidiphila]|uniref:DsbA family protein n=1 Tax=Methylocapsa acidiphila TaxID=133552 RepID=UPI000405BDE7|nr:DsbA family protein [Methylocapsa acidiphila]